MKSLEERICRIEEKLAYLEEGLEPFIEWKKKLVQDAIEFGKDIEKDRGFNWSNLGDKYNVNIKDLTTSEKAHLLFLDKYPENDGGRRSCNCKGCNIKREQLKQKEQNQ